MTDLAKMLILLGLSLALLGVLLLVAGKIPFLGRLPGDIVVERPGFRFYFPLGTSILLSVLLTLVFWILGKIR